MSSPTCTLCGTSLERVRYFPRQLITADDMRAEQEYFRQKLRRHNRFLHGWGVVCGLTVEPPRQEDPPWQVVICPGYAATPQGDEVLLNDPVRLDILLGRQDPEPCCDPWPCPPTGAMPGRGKRERVFIAIRYAECLSRPVRVHPAGCGCDETGCEYSRIRDSYEIKVLWELPQSHTDALAEDAKWREMVKQFMADSGTIDGSADRVRARLAPPCHDCIDDPWVVIAGVILPADTKHPIQASDISYAPRRVLWSVSDLMALLP